MTSSDRSSILAGELRTDLKNADCSFKILVKPPDFVVKHYIKIISMRVAKYIFVKFMIF